MKKLIVIGNACLEIAFQGSEARQPRPGGQLLRMAATIAADRRDIEVTMVSEASLDPVGDMIVKYLEDHGVVTRSVDRYGEGVTPLKLEFDTGAAVDYHNPSGEKLDVVWPRIDQGDVVVFGGLTALLAGARATVIDLLEYARTRKATIVYIPAVTASDIPRVTRVMPEILDNLERADAMIARPAELAHIFGCDDPTKCYRDHISFYCRRVAVVGGDETIVIDDNSLRRLSADGPDELIIAGLVSSLCTDS